MGIFDLKDRLGLVQIDNLWIGNIDGYQFSALDTVKGLKVSYVNFVFNQSLSNAMRIQIQKATRLLVVPKTLMKANDAISIMINYQVRGNVEEYVDKIIGLLHKATEEFMSLELNQYTECFLCGKVNDEDADLQIYEEFVVPMHNNCLTQYNTFIVEQKKLEDKRVKLLPISILYAIIGAVIGVIPSVITMVVLEIISVWLFMLIPIAAFYGYKLGRAPLRKYTTVIISIVSLVVVLAMQIIYWQVDAVAKGYNNFAHSLRYEENMKIFLDNLWKAVLFTGLGILLSWQIITKKK